MSRTAILLWVYHKIIYGIRNGRMSRTLGSTDKTMPVLENNEKYLSTYSIFNKVANPKPAISLKNELLNKYISSFWHTSEQQPISRTSLGCSFLICYFDVKWRYSVHPDLNPTSKTPLSSFLPSSLLNMEKVRAPLFRKLPLYISFFMNLPLP